MSEYIVLQTSYVDPGCLKLSLKELGYEFEEHKIAQKLYGFAGDIRDQAANIIVRRKFVGSASNDVGFQKRSDGKYDLIISEYDRKTPAIAKNFMEQLKLLYNKSISIKRLKQLGGTLTSTKTLDDGRIKIQAMI